MNSIDPFPTTIEDQKELIDRINAGCTESFAKLAVEFRPRIYRRILSEVNNHADAEDLTQDILVAVYKGLRKFDGRATLSTWIYRIVTNKMNEFWRFWSAEKRDKDGNVRLEALRSNDGDQNNSFDPSDPHCDQPFDRLLQKEKTEALLNAIDSLTEKEKQVVLLRLLGESHEMIAEILGISPGNSRVIYSRAEAKLKTILCEEDEDGSS